MLPYLITIIVLAFTSKSSRAPKAEGIPYDKGLKISFLIPTAALCAAVGIAFPCFSVMMWFHGNRYTTVCEPYKSNYGSSAFYNQQRSRIMNKYLDISPPKSRPLDEGRPVVALESTIISHGMPYPKNVETALLVEQTIRDNGAVPATIAVIGGRLKAGLSHEEIEYLGKTGRGVAKASRRDLPALVARGADGALPPSPPP